MKIFKRSNRKLTKIKEKKFNLEKDIQKITENNLETIFGLRFIRSEFTVQNFRIDTLAYDEQSKSFVIIEYKKGSSLSVIDQGMTYLSLMHNNKAEFIIEYNENMKEELKRNIIDWSQSRVIFIAESFNQFQTGALGFKDLPIELWQAKIFEEDLIVFNPIESNTYNKVSFKKIKQSSDIKRLSKEVITYDLNHHFKGNWTKSRELYAKLKEKIIGKYPETTERITKYYIPYIDHNTNKSFLEIVAQKQGVKVYLRPFVKQLNGPKIELNDCSKIGHWTNGNTYFIISKEEEIIYALDLIKQAYDILQKES